MKLIDSQSDALANKDFTKNSYLVHVERVCESREFANKPVMKKLLTYLVTELVEGRSDRIKGITIAVDVFNKGSDFDADQNALVRNAATRLRKMLKTYYLDEGSRDYLCIEIQKGTYIPSISRKKVSGTEPGTSTAVRLPHVAISPLLNLSGSEQFDYLASGFSLQLSDALTKYDDFRIIGLSKRLDESESQTGGKGTTKKPIDFLVDGDIQASGKCIRASLRLIDRSDQSTIWADHFDFNNNEDETFQQQDAIINRIASLIGNEYGHINQRRYESLLHSKPLTLSEQDLTLRQYHHNTLLTEKSALDFQQAVFDALEKEPESALLNAFAGDIYGQIYSLDFAGAEDALEKFNYHIEKAYSINPNHQLIIGSMAFKCLVLDDRNRFFNLLNKSREWVTASPHRLGGFALCTCLFGEWEAGKEILDEVFDNNLYIPGWLYGLVSLYHYQRAEYEQALEAADKYQIRGLHWRHIHRLVALSQLGDIEESRREFQALLKSRPNFVERGRHMMGILIKEPSLLEHLIEGFAKIGVKIS